MNNRPVPVISPAKSPAKSPGNSTLSVGFPTRRHLLQGAGALALGMAQGLALGLAQGLALPTGARAEAALPPTPAAPPAPATVLPEDIAFRIFVAGSEIGHHRLQFTPGPEAGTLLVRADIRMKVRLLFVTVFDYTQTTEEVWQDGRLRRFRSETVDGDNHDMVTAVQTAAGLSVESRRFGPRVLAAGIWPTTAFWRPDAVQRQDFLDAARGDLRTVETTALPLEFIDARGRRQPARRFHVETSRSFDVWYGTSGDWLKLQWKGFGLTADYRRMA